MGFVNFFFRGLNIFSLSSLTFTYAIKCLLDTWWHWTTQWTGIHTEKIDICIFVKRTWTHVIQLPMAPLLLHWLTHTHCKWMLRASESEREREKCPNPVSPSLYLLTISARKLKVPTFLNVLSCQVLSKLGTLWWNFQVKNLLPNRCL